MLKTAALRFVAPTLSAGFVRASSPATQGRALTALNQQVCEALAGISPLHDPRDRADTLARLHERHGVALREQWAALTQPVWGGRPAETQARQFNLDVGYHLGIVLDLGPDLLRLFGGADTPRGSPAQDLEVPWVQALLQESGRTFAALMADPRTRAMARVHAALFHRDDHAVMGFTLTETADRQAVERLQADAGGPVLDLRTGLQLCDHAHADTGSFNLYRAVDQLDRLVGEAGAGLQFGALTRRLAEGVTAIWRQPAARVAGDAYKGWISTPGLPLVPGQGFTWHRPVSATRERQHSYLLRPSPTLGPGLYDTELRLRGGQGLPLRAVHFEGFNTATTAHEAEVMLLPGQGFRVESREEEEVLLRGKRALVARCTACRVEDVESEAGETGAGGAAVS